MQFIIAEWTTAVSERTITFASWLAEPASHAFALVLPRRRRAGTGAYRAEAARGLFLDWRARQVDAWSMVDPQLPGPPAPPHRLPGGAGAGGPVCRRAPLEGDRAAQRRGRSGGGRARRVPLDAGRKRVLRRSRRPLPGVHQHPA